jgi:polar amino acid transport system substrate-binding protein
MIVFLARVLLLTIGLCVWPTTNLDAAPAQARKLAVGVAQVAPFGMKGAAGDWEGIGVDLWRSLAKKLNLTYEFVEVPDSELLPRLKQGAIDAVVGGFVITPEKEGAIEFSQAYYAADPAVGAPRKSIRSATDAILEVFFSWQFLTLFLPVLGILFLVGLVMYLIERKRDPEAYGGSRPRSLLFGTLWSTGMMTGVGGKTPETNSGRAIALVWLFIGLFLTSSFTASITRVLTADLLPKGMPSERDLPHERVAVLAGTDHPNLWNLGVSLSVFNSPQDVIGAVVRREVDVCIMSEPVLKYYAGKFFKGKIQVAPLSGRKTPYAIGLAPNSPLRKPLNIALLEFVGSQEWDSLLQQYLNH